MVYCCVPLCKSKSRSGNGISFHEFPSNEQQRQEWLNAISRKDFSPNFNSRSSVVCSVHFLASDFCPGLKVRRLRPNVIPSVSPTYPAHKLPAEKQTMPSQSKEFTTPSHLNTSLLCEMDQKVEIKQEPDWVEGTASTSLENFEFVSANSHLKEEPNSELTEPGATQPDAETEDEIIIPEQTVDQLDPLPKEEDRSFGSLYLHNVTPLKTVKSTTLTERGERPHVCNECGKTFCWKSKLEQHCLIHTGDRPHVCSQCAKTFYDKANLKRHTLTHSGDGRHVCNQCGKVFTQKSSLEQHTLIHTGEKPFDCNECGKAFSKKSNLQKHALTHSGVRPYDCVQCGALFTQKSSVKKHILIHTGEKPYDCITCRKTFANKSTLRRHTLTHTGERLHVCSQCGRAFSRKSILNKHILIHTADG